MIMAGWTRKTYESCGLTQYPPAAHLKAVQEAVTGAVILCLDVSGSMEGTRAAQAVVGCEIFLSQAVASHYRVGLILWHHDVEACTALAEDAEAALKLLRAPYSSGGTAVVPALERARALLTEVRANDKVVAVFGDGDLGDRTRALEKADELAAQGIRILTCGLGRSSAENLNAISTEGSSVPRTAEEGAITQAIANMSTGLRASTRP